MRHAPLTEVELLCDVLLLHSGVEHCANLLPPHIPHLLVSPDDLPVPDASQTSSGSCCPPNVSRPLINASSNADSSSARTTSSVRLVSLMVVSGGVQSTRLS